MQKVSFLYLVGKQYWGHSQIQHVLSIFESDTFERDFFDIFEKCMERVCLGLEMITIVISSKIGKILKVTLYASLSISEVHCSLLMSFLLEHLLILNTKGCFVVFFHE